MLAAKAPRAPRAAPAARDRRLCCRPVAFRGSSSGSPADPEQQPPRQRQTPPLPPSTTARPAAPAPPLPVRPLTTAGAALTAEESASLARVLELAPAAANTAAATATATATAATATSPLASPPMQAHLLQTLESAARHASSPDLPLLEGAILAAEQLFLQQQRQRQQQQAPATNAPPLTAATDPPAVASAAQGAQWWQPVFASSGGWPRLLFIPVPEYFVGTSASGNADGVAFDVVTELPGNITTHFFGERRWGQGADAGHVLEYEVHRVRIEWTGGNNKPPPGFTIPLPPPLRLKNALSFFAATPRWALARSRLGGTMLLRADPPAGRVYGAPEL